MASLKFYNVRIACGTFFCTLVISLIITPWLLGELRTWILQQFLEVAYVWYRLRLGWMLVMFQLRLSRPQWRNNCISSWEFWKRSRRKSRIWLTSLHIILNAQVKESNDLSRWAALESWKKEVDFSLSKIHATSSTHSAAMEELRSMFHSFMMSSKRRDEGSPSISKSAPKNEVSVAHKASKPAVTMDASKKQILVSLPAPGGGATGPHKSKRVPNANTAANVS